MNDVTESMVDKVYGRDLLDAEMDFEFMSAECRQRFLAPVLISNKIEPCPLQTSHDESMEVVEEGEVLVRQDQHRQPNHDGQARIGRDFQSFDVAPAPRLIKAQRHRVSRHRVYNPPYQNFESHSPGYANPIGSDVHRSRRDHYSPSQRRNASLATLKHRSEAKFIAEMADLDVKEEREFDRRGTDSYRGGGNKRRRDGRLTTANRPMLSS